jgi:hypothetical protein
MICCTYFIKIAQLEGNNRASVMEEEKIIEEVPILNLES